MFADRLNHQSSPRPIAVVGGGATGTITSLLLNALGLGPVTLLEAEAEVLSGLATSMNSVGTNHHMAWGGHPATMEHFFKGAVLFNELFPNHVFASRTVNYYVPGRTPDGSVNTAIETAGGRPNGKASIAARANATRLAALYRDRVESGKAAVFGPVDRFVKVLAESDLRRMIGGEPPPTNGGRWLVPESATDGFVDALQLRQSVVNNARFCVHLVQRLQEATQRGGLQILLRCRVREIRPAGQGFELLVDSARGQRRLRFHDVIQCGYAGGVGLSIPGVRDDGLHAALKIFGLYELPASIAESFVSFIMIRGQFGSAVRAGSRLISVCSGKEFDRDTITWPQGSVAGRRIPKHWTGLADPGRRAKALGGSDNELLDGIRKDIARWVPMIGSLRPVALKAAPQLYPRQRATADDVAAADRQESELDHCFRNAAGGQYFRLLGAKMVTIPHAAARAAAALLDQHVRAGHLSRNEVVAHLRFESGYAELSEALKIACGRDAPEAESAASLEVIRRRYNLPAEQLEGDVQHV